MACSLCGGSARPLTPGGNPRGCPGNVRFKTCYIDTADMSVKHGWAVTRRDPVTCAITFDGVEDEAGNPVLPRPTQVSCDCAQCAAVDQSGNRAQIVSVPLCLDSDGTPIFAFFSWDGTTLNVVGWREQASSSPTLTPGMWPPASSCTNTAICTNC